MYFLIANARAQKARAPPTTAPMTATNPAIATSAPSLFLMPIAAPEEVEAGGAVPEDAWVVAVAVPVGAALPEAFPLTA